MVDLLKLGKHLSKQAKKNARFIQCQHCLELVEKKSMVKHFYACKLNPENKHTI